MDIIIRDSFTTSSCPNLWIPLGCLEVGGSWGVSRSVRGAFEADLKLSSRTNYTRLDVVDTGSSPDGRNWDDWTNTERLGSKEWTGTPSQLYLRTPAPSQTTDTGNSPPFSTTVSAGRSPDVNVFPRKDKITGSPRGDRLSLEWAEGSMTNYDKTSRPLVEFRPYLRTGGNVGLFKNNSFT